MHYKQSRGVTIVELMVVVGLIAIIAAVAVPQFKRGAQKSKLDDAKSALSQLARAMDRQYNQQIPYTFGGNAKNGADTGKPDASFFASTAPLNSSNKYYNLRITKATATEYTVKATAINGVDVDPTCKTLVMKSDGTRTPTSCW